MTIKADCLHKAGVISEGERQWVYSSARRLRSAQRCCLIELTEITRTFPAEFPGD